MTAFCTSVTPPLTCFASYKGIHVLVKVAGEVGADQSALRMQACRALARLALDPDAHQPIMMSGALQHILALAKQDHMDPLRLDGACLPAPPRCRCAVRPHSRRGTWLEVTFAVLCLLQRAGVAEDADEAEGRRLLESVRTFCACQDPACVPASPQADHGAFG